MPGLMALPQWRRAAQCTHSVCVCGIFLSLCFLVHMQIFYFYNDGADGLGVGGHHLGEARSQTRRRISREEEHADAAAADCVGFDTSLDRRISGAEAERTLTFFTLGRDVLVHFSSYTSLEARQCDVGASCPLSTVSPLSPLIQRVDERRQLS